jgi:hypothetical protein
VFHEDFADSIGTSAKAAFVTLGKRTMVVYDDPKERVVPSTLHFWDVFRIAGLIDDYFKFLGMIKREVALKSAFLIGCKDRNAENSYQSSPYPRGAGSAMIERLDLMSSTMAGVLP